MIPAGRRADAAPRGDPGVGRHAGGAEARPAPPDGGLRRLPRVHRPPRRPAARRARRPRRARRTRSSTTSSATTAPRPRARSTARFNEMINFNGAAALETPEFMMERLDEFGGPDSYNHYAVGWAHAMCTPYQWTKQVASHWGGTRNGTIVHWPAGIEARGEIRSQFTHVIDVAPTVLEAAGLPAADVRARRPAEADRRREHGLLLRRRRRRRAPHDAVLRDVRQPRHLPPGLDGGDQARHPVDDDRRAEAGLRRRRLGALRHDDRLDAGARPRSRAAREARRAAAAVPDRGHQVQRAPARRPRRIERAHPGARRTADARAGRPAAPLRRHGPPVRELGRQHQEQVARRHRRDRGARGRRAGRDHRPGRQHRRLEPLPQGRQAALLLQPPRASSASTSTATARCPPAPTRCAWSSTTPAPGSARAATSTLYLDGAKVGEGDGRARRRP